MPSHPRIGLRGLIVTCMVIIAICPSLVILPMLVNLSRLITQRQAIATLQTTTQAVAEQLSRGLRVQWQEVQRLAAFAAEGEDKDRLRLRFDTIVATNPNYAWLGMADPAGMVIVAAGGVLEGVSVIERPWFKAGLSGPFAGDVHGALPLQKYVVPLVDFALPVRRGDGVPVGVLGAHVRWDAVRELFTERRGGGSIDVMLLARDGTVLVGPAEMEGKRLPLQSALVAGQGIAHTGVETWPDETAYLTTTIPALSFKDVPSFGWSLVARQPVAVALVDTYIATSQLGPVIVLCGLAIVAACVHFGWWVARPLGRLTRAAEALSTGTLGAPVPHERLYREVSVLSDALGRIDSRPDSRPDRRIDRRPDRRANSKLDSRPAGKAAA
ncbi:MAG: hypothetical protein QOG78_2853 [Rhodospirillaceae bacterium]|jgi:HAMP domain-containing protein|nr:hypothetical protein [Rhodospirillaceae bacterium]